MSAAAAVGIVGASAYYLTHVNQKKIVPNAHTELGDWEDEDPEVLNAKKLRARKLADLAKKELTSANLRALFRLLDDDGSYEVSPAEIQRGLLLLGFENAADPVALSRLLVDIDEDKTGTITESEFMAFFSTQDRISLRSKLDSYVIERAFITATFYGTAGGRPTIRTEIVQPARLRDWLNALPPNRGRLWLDVVGYDSDAHSVLAEALGMEADDICAALLFQQPKLAIVNGPLGPRANCILHTMSISVSPLIDKSQSWIAKCCPSIIARCLAAILGIELGGDDLLDNKILLPKNNITSTPPAISLEQAAIIVVDERTVVSLRAPAFDGEGDNTKFKEASVSAADDELANDDSVIRRIYNDVRTQMAENSPAVAHLFTSSVKGLAVVLMDSILQHNYSLRDALQDWDEVLTKDIRKSPASLHTPHLEAIRALTESFERALKPLVEALNPNEWDKGSPSGTPLKGSNHGSTTNLAGITDPSSTLTNPPAESLPQPPVVTSPPPQTKIRSVAALQSQASFRQSATSGMIGIDNAPVGELEGMVGLRQFFRSNLSEFNELAQDLQSMVNDMDEKKTKIASNITLLGSLKADMMNRTLYALTLLTAVSVPITSITGLWGMNFADMNELDPEMGDELGLPLSGYRVFWTVLVSVVGTVIIGMWRMGLFKALQ